MTGQWIDQLDRKPDAAATLYLVPHAGAGSAVVRPLNRLMPDWLDVRGVMLPMREARMLEEPAHDLAATAEALAAAIIEDAKARRGRVFVGGVCSGAWIAYAAATRLAQGTLAGYVAAARGPGPGVGAAGFDPGMLEGFDAELRENAEMLEILMERVHADCDLASDTVALPRLDAPILAVAGANDRHVIKLDLEAWGRLSDATLKVMEIRAGHFLLAQPDIAAFAAAIADWAGPLVPASPPLARAKVTVPRTDLFASIRTRLELAGTPRDIAAGVGHGIAEAEARGHADLGLPLLARLLEDVAAGRTDPARRPVIVSDSGSVVRLDAQDGFCITACYAAADLAAQRAKSFGLGLAVVARCASPMGTPAMLSDAFQRLDVAGLVLGPHGQTGSACLILPGGDVGPPHVLIEAGTSGILAALAPLLAGAEPGLQHGSCVVLAFSKERFGATDLPKPSTGAGQATGIGIDRSLAERLGLFGHSEPASG